MRSYKNVTYKGYTIHFDQKTGGIFARVPKITRQYLGFGKTKKTALADAKKAIDHLIAVKRRR